MRAITKILAALFSVLFLAGCASENPANDRDAIPFSEGEMYAVAHLGYQEMGSLDSYVQSELGGDSVPVHYLSSGDYYLIIPRYDGMKLSLYRGDIDSPEPTLIFEDPDCCAFVIQCNASDIFADATVVFEYGGETVEFSPFISLKDGTLDVGERGLDITSKTEG